jgi:two-component sensor histidine kinase
MATGTLTPSPELNRLLGFPPEARPTAEEARSRYAPGERERVAAEGEAIWAAGGDRIQTTARFVMPDGSERHLLIRAQVKPGSGGDAPRVIGVLADVTEAERREKRLQLVNRELHHRLLNLISVISVIARRSFSDEAERERFEGRLQAMGLGIRATLGGDGGAAELPDLLHRITDPFEEAVRRIQVEGPRMRLPAVAASACAFAFHELATNAMKYGALRDPAGAIAVSWTRAGGRARIEWRETLGVPLAPPEAVGFGSTLITRMLFRPPDSAAFEFTATGVLCRLDVGIEAG